MGLLGNLFGGSSSSNASKSNQEGAATRCKAFQAGRCVVRGADSGPCSWNPTDWQRCGVVIENKKFYGEW